MKQTSVRISPEHEKFLMNLAANTGRTASAVQRDIFQTYIEFTCAADPVALQQKHKLKLDLLSQIVTEEKVRDSKCSQLRLQLKKVLR